MPKCINDKKKSYKGDEPSPKGLGYCASAEPVGKVMIGKDNNNYITKEISNGQRRWVKHNQPVEIIDFDNIPIEDMNEVYFPVVSKKVANKENGLEEKFGGNVPFFIKGEKWPMVGDVPMTFFCQIKDPREKNTKFLYRIFIGIDSPNFYEECWISKIELTEENLKNQIFLDKPECDLSNTEMEEINTFHAYLIESWAKDYELKQLDYYKEKFNIEDANYGDHNFDAYYNSNKAPNHRIKVGGTPTSTQDEDTVQEYNLLQLTDCKWMPYMWGDCGIAHISNDCKLIWDCC